MNVERPPTKSPAPEPLSAGAGAAQPPRTTDTPAPPRSGASRFQEPPRGRAKTSFLTPPGDTTCAKRSPVTSGAGDDGQGHIGIARLDLLLGKGPRTRGSAASEPVAFSDFPLLCDFHVSSGSRVCACASSTTVGRVVGGDPFP